MSSPVVISAALTGVLATRELCPAIPYTPREIGEEARRAADAGASIVHIHARNPEGGPEWRVETFAEILSEVRKRSDVIVNFSTGAIGIPVEQRIAHIRQLQPEIGALNMGSMNYAIYSAKKKAFYQDHVFVNPFKDILFFLEAMNGAGVRPELECFDTGHIGNTAPLIDMGALKVPYQFSLIMGVLGGIPGTTRHLTNQVETLPEGAHWQVIGIGLKQWALVAAAITMGGNVRVGLEDNFYLEEGRMAKSNGELVEKAARLSRDLGRAVASIEEARRILGLGIDD
ncbi:MAG: 3-keto-5-aminohexanoate cleavage protein [Chloroflexi bacterium 13_1_40CM_4_65_16]|nr:MAG: 3-keto-5-aminohexanoate cleavage protein [Chloroflexi bacterium 13_1_40CM_4_65_16]TMF65487.1 MAG: 3-keto-5-aminohexanoate cleavage protein [Chloroflexota bacterium]TMF86459.1 MAG: 3-keto-5-aminohexanoate cleavage protein [Chloroflexota bacterium]TMG08927.1 MAG: 3-keto-5-aminohexanoate cleavage protein [Chloroflexota bacterium]